MKKNTGPEMNENTCSETTWAGTKWSGRKWMTDPVENLLLTLMTTNLDFPAIKLNRFLGKYSTGKKIIQRLQRDWFLSTHSIQFGKDK